LSVISGFYRGVNYVCILLACYTVQTGS